MSRRSPHATLALAAGAAAALAVPLLPVTASAVGGAATVGSAKPKPVVQRALGQPTVADRHDAPRPSSHQRGKVVASAPKTSPQRQSPTSGAKRAVPQANPTPAATVCTGLGLQAIQLRDRTYFAWDAQSGVTSSYTLKRLRDGSTTWQTAATVPATATTALDRRMNPFFGATYTLDFTQNGVAKSCAVPAPDGTAGGSLAMAEDAGPGYVDVVSTTDQALGILQQSDVSEGITTASGGAYTMAPAFSPDGLWMAYSRMNAAGTWEVVAQRADGLGGQSVWATSARDNVTPSWSADGRYLAWSSVAHTADGPAKATSGTITVYDRFARTTRSVTPSTFLQGAVYGGDSSILIGSRTDGSGIAIVNTTTGATTTLANTAGGRDAAQSPDGTVLFVVNKADGTTDVKRRLANGSVVTVFTTAANTTARYPKQALDGSLWYLSTTDSTPADTTDPVDVGVSVRYQGTSYATNIGFAHDSATSVPTGFAIRQQPTKSAADYTGDGAGDLLARNSAGALLVYPNVLNVNKPTGTPKQIGSGWGGFNAIIAAGDWTGDGQSDILARNAAGDLLLYAVKGGAVRPGQVIGRGWGGFTITAVGDWDGDTNADLVARDTAGTLWLYRGSGTGGVYGSAFLPRVQIGAGWTMHDMIVGVGDADYDNRPDIVARNASSGALVLYGGGGVAAAQWGQIKTVASQGFKGFTQIQGTERFTGNPTSLFLLGTDGAMWDGWFIGDGVYDLQNMAQFNQGGGPFTWAG